MDCDVYMQNWIFMVGTIELQTTVQILSPSYLQYVREDNKDTMLDD